MDQWYMYVCITIFLVLLLVNCQWKGIYNNFDGVVLEIFLDYKLQRPKRPVNCESFEYEEIT